MKGVEVSTDKNRLDLEFVTSYLQSSYWADKRTKEAIKISLENSLCFGLYLNNTQIGFARVVTDTVVFAYLMDVFIDDTYKGHGLGSLLLDQILKHKNIREIETFKLATQDAHEFYKKKGFHSLEHPEFQMEKIMSTDV